MVPPCGQPYTRLSNWEVCCYAPHAGCPLDLGSQGPRMDQKGPGRKIHFFLGDRVTAVRVAAIERLSLCTFPVCKSSRMLGTLHASCYPYTAPG